MEHIFNEAANKGGVYRIRNKINGTPYIGSTNRFKKRCYDHESSLRRGKHQNPHLQPAWNLYGEDAFVFEILEIVEEKSVKKRHTIEEKYINEVWPNCYNYRKKTTKKIGPWSSTPEETRKKMSEARKGYKQSKETIAKAAESRRGQKRSEEFRKRMSEVMKGNKNTLGYKHTEESRKKFSEAKKGEKNPGYGKPSWNKGLHFSEESRKKMSDAHKGKKLTEEHKKKISEAGKSHKAWNKGKKHTKEARKKMARAAKNRKTKRNA